MSRCRPHNLIIWFAVTNAPRNTWTGTGHRSNTCFESYDNTFCRVTCMYCSQLPKLSFLNLRKTISVIFDWFIPVVLTVQTETQYNQSHHSFYVPNKTSYMFWLICSHQQQADRKNKRKTIHLLGPRSRTSQAAVNIFILFLGSSIDGY